MMKHMLIICREVTLTFVKPVGRERRVVVPARRLVTYRRAAACLPSRRGK